MRSVPLIMLLVLETASAGFEHRDAGGRSRALGGACTGRAGDVWTIVCNPGGLSQLSMKEVSFYSAPQPFGLAELSHTAAALALPTGFGVVGISGSRYGFDLYRECSAGISFAGNIEGVGAGMSLHYYAVSVQNYGSAGTIGIDAGIYVPILPELSSGIAIRNINAPSAGIANEPLPQKFSIGLAFAPAQSMDVAVDYQKETGFDASARFGFEYRVMASVALRGGMSDEPSQSSCGVGFRYSAMELDYALTRHRDLGWSHQASITLRW